MNSEVFCLQVDKERHMSSDVAAVREMIEEHNWLRPNDNYKYLESENADVNSADIIPVGSIEYVESFLGCKVQPFYYPFHNINDDTIARENSYTTFYKRQVAFAHGKDELEQLFDSKIFSNANEGLFVKSASRLKCDYTGIYKKKHNIPDDEKYFVSDIIPNIVAEWRLFVHRGEIIAARPYILEQYIAPDYRQMQELVGAISSLPAYTLDIAIDNQNVNFPIEIHNFISCGLYGLHSHRVLSMLIQAYNYERSLSVGMPNKQEKKRISNYYDTKKTFKIHNYLK